MPLSALWFSGIFLVGGKSVATKKAATKKAAANKATAKKSSKKTAASKEARVKRGNPAKKQTSSKSAKTADNYTKPELREKVKAKVIAGDKGGRPGQWSARKAQLVAHEYEEEGGGYKHARSAAQKSLKSWGEEKWHTADGKQAIQGEETHRYLPDAAWKKLSPEEKKATDRKKVAASKRGKQFVSNTPAARTARKRVSKPRD